MTRANRDDVARLAGVSTAVVSYVINNGPRPVAQATRERVLAAMDELSYRPNASARALKLARTSVIGLLMSDITNPFFSEFAMFLQGQAHARGYGLMIANTRQENAEETAELQSMLARGVDGIAVYGARRPETLSAIVRSGVRAVSMDWHLTASDVPSIGIDDYGATTQAVEHLLGHGHSEVAFIAGTDDLTLRVRAWSDTMRTRCTPERLAQLRVTGDFTREGGYDAATTLLELPDPPRAIFVSTDVQAFGALAAVRDLGLSVPADVAIVSFDGTNASAFTSPPLTAIRIPQDRIAQLCIEKLTSVPSAEPMHSTFPHELVIRESCGCHPRSM
ncbi:LacI family DNA-binding transcriptional regulator [Promicromonospora vindobonensis]|uniref:LacI family DNA-binding transcriptional regulator n=1 Tax=Promicromonospora vindobonensis TaxID=195748 RepID=A0ABW5VU60_9MICO